jgi:hypothetical protein
MLCNSNEESSPASSNTSPAMRLHLCFQPREPGSVEDLGNPEPSRVLRFLNTDFEGWCSFVSHLRGAGTSN